MMRPTPSPLLTLCLVPLLLTLAVTRAAGQDEEGAQPAPFGRHAVGVEFTATALVEAWNRNERRDWLAGGSAGIWWTFRERATLLVEVQLARVYQPGTTNAFVQGLSPLLRLRACGGGRQTVFLELGPGISWSDVAVPLRGTRFNYLAIAGGGVTRRLSPQTEAVLGFRWVHLSNAGREGRDRNPDIEALGPYAGVRIAF